jgi:phosphatidylethanolamine/phosphatidyl-N-methylethanolamine N-methyltransferase
MKVSTRWNRVRYTVWAPFYDLVVGFGSQRRRSIELLELQPGDRILIVGAGTGADLPFLPPGIDGLVTDVTPAMLERARPRLRPGLELAVMDGQRLEVADGSFDAVILHLVLAVVPHPAACLREAARAVRPGGRIAVFDKFLPQGGKPGLLRRVANTVSGLLFTEINRVLEDVLAASGATLEIVHDEPALLGGAFRIVQLRKAGSRSG